MSSVQDIRTCAANVGSDHKLIMSKLKMRLRKEQKSLQTNNLDTAQLNDPEIFQNIQ